MRIAAVLDDRQPSAVPQFAPGFHRRVQPEVIVELDDVFLGDGQRRPGAMIRIVGVGDDGVEAIVATLQFDNDQATAGSTRLGRGGDLVP